MQIYLNVFGDQNIGLATIYRTIWECEESVVCINLLKSGQPEHLPPNRISIVIQSAQDKVRTSSLKLTPQFRILNMIVSRI